jgi:septum formation protein
MPPTLLLASASPRRRELLERVGLPFAVQAADLDESPLPAEEPARYVARIAKAKAAAIARAPRQWILAADTTVTIDGDILGKPATASEATAMLMRLVGRTHAVLTGFAIRGEDHHGVELERVEVISTAVEMIECSGATVADYVASGEWRGKAGAYALQGIAAALVDNVRGSVTNVIGLPLAEVLAALRELGGPVANFAAGVPQ